MKSNEGNNYGSNVKSTSVPETPGEIHKVDTSKQSAYHDGYVHGRVSEHNRDVVRQEVRDNDNAARGLLLGIILTSLVGLTAGALYFMNQRNNQPVPASAPVIVPAAPTASPSPAATTRTDTTVIEREVPVSSPEPTIIERTVPVPVPVPSNSPNQTTIIERETVVPVPSNSSPDINITVPNGQSNPASTTEPRGSLEKPASSGGESKGSSPSRATESQEASPDGNSDTSGENR
ncbi:hypothetical protein NG798_11995 [Ancylothrix sp. C2]|uniref:hypothetical protein n=1 Tax=Ancylothrix sp. D3o TaxID=2953691 RepID=UPI0021BA43AD|nr:hypothetical protein [Ancylothrix sp. D3o]MCT7950513.1 hypothetical protein [Ancylothrix sp. D3o]